MPRRNMVTNNGGYGGNGGFTPHNRQQLPSELPGLPMEIALKEEPTILAAICAVFMDTDIRLGASGDTR